MGELKLSVKSIWWDAQDRPLTYYLGGFFLAIMALLTGWWVNYLAAIVFLTLAIFASSDTNLIMESADEGD